MTKTDNEWRYEFSGRIMQAMLSNPKMVDTALGTASELKRDFEDVVVDISVKYAERLLNRLKEGEL